MNIVPGSWPKRGSKYKNQATEVAGIKFDSKHEASRYRMLKILETAEKISDLKLQVRYKLDVNGYHICDYIADFTYKDEGLLIVEDAKGYKTDIYSLKKKLMLACYGIAIKET